jgi:hypothetical protein
VSDINVVSDYFLCFFVNLAAHCPEGIKLKVIPKHVISPQTGGKGMPLYPCSTTALERGGFSTPRSGLLTPLRETSYPLYKRLDRAPVPVWIFRNILPTMEFEPRTIHPIRRRYTDYTIPAVV